MNPTWASGMHTSHSPIGTTRTLPVPSPPALDTISTVDEGTGVVGVSQDAPDLSETRKGPAQLAAGWTRSRT